MALIELHNESKHYQMGSTLVQANENVSFEIESGSITIILGPSGAGKSTVLNILGGMDIPTSGRVIVDETDIAQFSNKQLTHYRRVDVGFIFQFYNLVPNLTAIENVELASQLVDDAYDAKEMLEKVGLGHRLANFPAQLSGGEQQRVTIARALAKKPKLLLADEPTGALDYETGKQILQLLEDAAKKDGTTVVIITHNSQLAPMANRVIRMNDGKVQQIDDQKNPVSIHSLEW